MSFLIVIIDSYLSTKHIALHCLNVQNKIWNKSLSYHANRGAGFTVCYHEVYLATDNIFVTSRNEIDEYIYVSRNEWKEYLHFK